MISMAQKAKLALLASVAVACTVGNGGIGDLQVEDPQVEWVGVLERADSPNDRRFEARVQAIQATSQLQLGSQLVVSPAACWEGLQEDLNLPEGSYVAAVIGQSRDEADKLAASAGYEIEPTQRLSMCQD